VGRAILPAAGFQPALAASKGGCGQDWPPHECLDTWMISTISSGFDCAHQIAKPSLELACVPA